MIKGIPSCNSLSLEATEPTIRPWQPCLSWPQNAQEQGHDVILFLWNEAVTLARPGIGDHVIRRKFAPIKRCVNGYSDGRYSNMGVQRLCRGEKDRGA